MMVLDTVLASLSTARALGMVREGVAMVEITVIEVPQRDHSTPLRGRR